LQGLRAAKTTADAFVVILLLFPTSCSVVDADPIISQCAAHAIYGIETVFFIWSQLEIQIIG